jgi:hypothetical protein
MGMVPAARQVEGDVEAFFFHQSNSLEGCAGTQCGTVVQPLKDRAVGVSQAEPEIGPGFAGCTELLEAGDVVWIMKAKHQVVIYRAAAADLHAGKL